MSGAATPDAGADAGRAAAGAATPDAGADAGRAAGAPAPQPPATVHAAAVRRLRLAAQGLSEPLPADVAGIVARLVGVQAQDDRFARHAFRARSGGGLVAADVDRARFADRTVVCTWAMRGTLHLLAADDSAWIVGLLGPIFAAAGRRRRLALGLDDALCERALVLIDDVLATDGPLPRFALVERLAARGVRVEAGGQAPAHLVAYAALRGVICRGPVVDGEPAYVRLADWLGAASAAADDAEAAFGELALRYLAGHAPAAPADLAAWSGIGMRRARAAFARVARRLREVATPAGPAWALRSSPLDPPPPQRARDAVRLLGHFDPYLLGYADRDLVLDRRWARRIQAGGGFIRPAVIVDGIVVAGWRARTAAGALEVTLEPFAPLDDAVRAAIGAQVSDLARFLGASTAALRPADELPAAD